ncbi:MAG: molybdate ABC transporter substrate-binding protein [Ramlibacter sp.]|nr:molybdate ABC transporter substrate-binding protein [Ramlibacter sp.]
MRRRKFVNTAVAAWAGTAVFSSWSQAGPATIRVAAASDLTFALADVAQQYMKQTGRRVQLNMGSSGNFARQIEQGLPVDLFMSADEDFVLKLAAAGLTRDRGALYALGRIALFAGKASPVALDAQLLGVRNGWSAVRHFALANPEHAPYGRVAQQALEKLGLWELVKPKLVLGENISQATQFLTTGAAEVGITAYSLALAPEIAQQGRHLLLPDSLHAPLRQRMVLLKSAGPDAVDFYNHLQSSAARAVLERYGFVFG